MGWRQPKTTDETLPEKVIVRQFARTNNLILAGTDPELDENNHRNQLRHEERGGGKEIAQNGQGSGYLGDVAGQPKPTCYENEFCAQNK